MFTESAELYDLIYSQFKDYEAEAQQIAGLIQNIHPQAQSILDVACGTGEHARLLAQNYEYTVDGLDLEEALIARAEHKHPEGTFFKADMRSFDLERSYDVILCLFSSIGYVQTLDQVVQALSHFRKHLNTDGVVMVEPWSTQLNGSLRVFICFALGQATPCSGAGFTPMFH